MKALVILMTAALMSCGVAVSKPSAQLSTQNRKQVRVTYYWAGEDRFGSKTSTGGRAIPLKTCAVDPKLFKYGSQIHIPSLNKTLIANDTGTAVKSRKAAKRSGKDVPVIDVFVSNRKEAEKLARTRPKFMDVYVMN